MSYPPRFLLISALLLVAAAPVSRAETWFQEAKQIRLDADRQEARSRNFKILPDFEISPEAIKAGAIFTNRGQRVIARRTWVHVFVPIRRANGDAGTEVRDREQRYNGEPQWTGRWRLPWQVGFFEYTVAADYKGNRYDAHFKVGRNGLISGR